MTGARIETEPVAVPASILKTVKDFCHQMHSEESISAMANALKIGREEIGVYIASLKKIFIGEQEV